MTNYLILVFAVACASAVQLVVKGRFNTVHGEFPSGAAEFYLHLIKLFKDPWMWLAGIMLVASALLWYFVVSRISLGVAFSFAALSYPFVMLGSFIFLGEHFYWQQYMGCGLIVVGLLLIGSAA